MTDTTPTHCGHDPRFVVSADEGTAYCAMCELEATQKTLNTFRLRAYNLLKIHESIKNTNLQLVNTPCRCELCQFARSITYEESL